MVDIGERTKGDIVHKIKSIESLELSQKGTNKTIMMLIKELDINGVPVSSIGKKKIKKNVKKFSDDPDGLVDELTRLLKEADPDKKDDNDQSEGYE